MIHTSWRDDINFVLYVTKRKPIEDKCTICEKYYADCDKFNHMCNNHAEEIVSLRKFITQFNRNDKKDNECVEKIDSILLWTKKYDPQQLTTNNNYFKLLNEKKKKNHSHIHSKPAATFTEQ